MKTVMKKCPDCGNYTLKTNCPKCNIPTVMPIPARYSPTDRFGKYRRAMKLTKE